MVSPNRTMMKLKACPRCEGAVLELAGVGGEDGLCINCGWRRPDVPVDIQEQVEARLGQRYVDDHYTQSRIGTGKPPLSGWDRVKLRREREQRQSNDRYVRKDPSSVVIV